MPMKQKQQLPPQEAPKESDGILPAALQDKLVTLREKAGNSADLNVHSFYINDVAMSMVTYDGMVDKRLVAKLVLDPLLAKQFRPEDQGEELYTFIRERTVMATEMFDTYTFSELFRFLTSGFVALLIDGVEQVVVIGVQGFSFRSVSEPTSEMNEKGSKEGFVEPVRINMTMLRRRFKTPYLKFEFMNIGTVSQTDICLVYLTNTVSKKMLRQLKRQLQQIETDLVLTSGYLQPFLESRRASLFSDVGITERPDTLCAKIKEGRIGILIDGTPFALVAPYLFSEHFQAMDDYANRPYYASFVRILKYICFVVSIALPGLYVALGTFHPELFPQALLFNIAAAQEITPFPLMIEAIVIHFIYEVMREAGLRLPRAVGHAVSIVGSLVIGDAAVTAGLIGSPMVLVVTLTAISSFVTPSLQEPVSVLRFLYILLGGTMGLYGMALLSAMVLTNVCALSTFGVPHTAPIAPLTLGAMRDTFVRVGFKRMQKHSAQLRHLRGVHIEDEEA